MVAARKHTITAPSRAYNKTLGEAPGYWGRRWREVAGQDEGRGKQKWEAEG